MYPTLLSKIDKKKAIEECFEMIGLACSSASGDPTAHAQLAVKIAGMPVQFGNYLFYNKLELFLEGVALDEKNREKLKRKLEASNTSEFSLRLVELINRCESERKVRYISNATRCLLNDHIDRAQYFRICSAVTSALDEDLAFLREHLFDGDDFLEYSIEAQGLANVGLMLQGSRADARPSYTFTPLARLVDQFAISFGDATRYPEPGKPPEAIAPKVPNQVMEQASDDDIDRLFDND